MLFPHSPSSECLAELEFSGPFAKGEAFLDSNHCPDLRDSVMLWSIYIWIFESFTSIIYSNFYHIYADYAEFWAVWGLILANDTATCAARPVCKPKVKCNQRVFTTVALVALPYQGFFDVFCVWYWALKVQDRISGRMHELVLDCYTASVQEFF